MKFAVVIPTRNRKELLFQLLENLSSCESPENLHVVVIDSSDERITFNASNPFQFHYIHTEIKSAARQRNIGLSELNHGNYDDIDFIAFLDDDTRIEADYFTKVETGFRRFPEAVGISGITDPVSRPKSGLLRKIFGIYGEPGKIAKGGVNVPVDNQSIHTSYFETNWLIGCSVWRYESIRGHRFQDDFQGQSLFEDVIFSFQQSKIGKLLVLSSLKLTHLQTPIERPDAFRHNFDWVKNRYRLFELFDTDFHKRDFWIANFGKLIYECGSLVWRPKRLRMQSIAGLIAGGIKVIRK